MTEAHFLGTQSYNMSAPGWVALPGGILPASSSPSQVSSVQRERGGLEDRQYVSWVVLDMSLPLLLFAPLAGSQPHGHTDGCTGAGKWMATADLRAEGITCEQPRASAHRESGPHHSSHFLMYALRLFSLSTFLGLDCREIKDGCLLAKERGPDSRARGGEKLNQSLVNRHFVPFGEWGQAVQLIN